MAIAAATSPAPSAIAATMPDQDARRAISPQRLIEEIRSHLEVTVTPKTLANWRSAKKGPAFLRVGRSVRYPLPSVRTWLERQRRNSEDK